jgi:hypothetical protein
MALLHGLISRNGIDCLHALVLARAEMTALYLGLNVSFKKSVEGLKNVECGYCDSKTSAKGNAYAA